MRNIYHTNTKLAYFFGILDNQTAMQIPAGTLDYWKKNTDVSRIFGIEKSFDYDKDVDTLKRMASAKKLLSFFRAVLYISDTIQLIFTDTHVSKAIYKIFSKDIVTVISKVSNTIGFRRSLNVFKISSQQFYSWKRKAECVSSPLGLCRRIYYNQLSEKEVNVVKKYLTNTDFIHWSVVSTYYRMLRDKAAFMSLSTFYKYSSLLNLTLAHKPSKKKRYHIGLRANAPKKILHLDTTQIKALDGTRIFISLIIDNFSRCILGWKASMIKSSAFVVENLKDVILKHHMFETDQIIDLIVDGGSENMGSVDDFLMQPKTNIRKLVAMLDIIFSNSMIESVNKKIKYEYLFTREIASFKDFLEFMPIVVENYNNRPHSKLFGLHPIEALNGALPDKHAFTIDIRSAVTNRIVNNLNIVCNKCLN